RKISGAVHHGSGGAFKSCAAINVVPVSLRNNTRGFSGRQDIAGIGASTDEAATNAGGGPTIIGDAGEDGSRGGERHQGARDTGVGHRNISFRWGFGYLRDQTFREQIDLTIINDFNATKKRKNVQSVLPDAFCTAFPANSEIWRDLQLSRTIIDTTRVNRFRKQFFLPIFI